MARLHTELLKRLKNLRATSAKPATTHERHKFHLTPATGLALAGLVALCLGRLLGWIEATPLAFVLAACVLIAEVFLASFKRPIRTWLSNLFSHREGQSAHPGARGALAWVCYVLLVAALLAACVLSASFALEVPLRADARAATVIADQFRPYLWIQLAMVASAVLAAYFLCGRRGEAVTALIWICALAGLGLYYVYNFKGTVVLPSDLLALGTAAAVAGGYTYNISTPALAGLSWAVVGTIASQLLGLLRQATFPQTDAQAQSDPVGTKHSRRFTKRQVAGIVSQLAAGLLSLAVLIGLCTVPNYTKMTGEGINYFYPIWTYSHYGSLLSFVMGVQDLQLVEPAGYSEVEAQQLEATLAENYDSSQGATNARQAAEAQYSKQAPSVVVVMDETFSDLSIFDQLHAGYTGPEFFKSQLAPKSLATGSLAVNVLGGGTANTEFEFLTGVSMAYLGAGKYPYAIYNLDGAPSLPRQLSKAGYTTWAMHPNLPNNWNRKKAYAALGFDHFLTLDDFAGAPVFHNGVTDRATFDKVLDLLSTADKNEPQFIFDVTMQNHSNYDKGNIPSDRLTSYQPEDMQDEHENALLNEYLSCIKASDEDLQYLVDELSKLDRPVVLVYFGDHQPNLSNTYNDAWYTSEDSLTHAERTHQTVYSIWANYAVAGSSRQTGTAKQASTSANFLAAQTLQLIGAPLTSYQKAQLALVQTMPAVNAFGALDKSDTWHKLTDASASTTQAAQDLSWLTWLEFSSKVS